MDVPRWSGGIMNARAIAISSLLALIAAKAASACDPGLACIPDGRNCSAPPTVVLMDLPNSNNHVGVNPGVCGWFKVVIRDALSNPVANSVVTLDFSRCASGTFQVASTQSDPAVTVSCAGRRLSKTTNQLGEVCFSPEGATNVVDLSDNYPYYAGLPSRNLGPISGGLCCWVYADGILIKTLSVIINKYDLNDDGHVNASDYSYLMDAMGFGSYRTFVDYNADGLINSADGSLHLDAIGNARAQEVVYSALYCLLA